MISAYGGQGPRILAVGWSLSIVASILLALRLFVWTKITKQGAWPLFWSLVAWALTMVEMIFGTIAIRYGLGNHTTIVLEAGQMSNMLLFTWLSIFMFHITVAFGKLTVVSLLLEIQGQTHPHRRALLYFIAVSNIVLSLPNLFLVFFHCRPPKALWDPMQQEKCDVRVQINYTYFLTCWAALSDITLAVIPSFIVWPLQMKTRLKLAISCLMGLGIFAGVSAIMVGVELKAVTEPDFPYALSMLLKWAKSEGWVVIIASSVPPVYPLFRPWIESKAGYGKRTRDSINMSALSAKALPKFCFEGSSTQNHPSSEHIVPRRAGNIGDVHGDLENHLHKGSSLASTEFTRDDQVYLGKSSRH